MDIEIQSNAFLTSCTVVLSALLLFAGCGPAAQSRQSTALVTHLRSVPRSGAQEVVAAAQQLQRAYRASDWSLLAALVVDRSTRGALLSAMKTWRQESIKDLSVSVVYARQLSRDRYVGTLELAGNSGGVPRYRIFLFRPGTRVAKIVGVTSGLRGTSYRDASWAVSHTAHFVVYHSPYQLVGTDRSLLEELEAQRSIFERKFGVRLPPRAAYYLYPDQATMNRLTHGGCGSSTGEVGCTNPFARPPTIQSLTIASFHEPIHVYELSLEPPGKGKLVWVAPLFIAEGTAVALQDPNVDPAQSTYCSDLDFVPLDVCARSAMDRVRPVGVLSDKGFHSVDPGDAYALGGSFVKFLIERFGYKRLGRFYDVLASQPSDRERDYDVATGRVYHRTIRALLGHWTATLCRGGCG